MAGSTIQHSGGTMGELLQPWHLIVLFAIFLFFVIPFKVLPVWLICRKAGLSPWLSLLYIIPLGGLILNFVLAFADWKVIPAQQSYSPQQATPPRA
jgi:hypothetical protein